MISQFFLSCLLLSVSKKKKSELPYDPVTPLLGIYGEKIATQKYTCTSMFTAALFTVVETWKQPKYPPTDEYTKMMWSIYGV